MAKKRRIFHRPADDPNLKYVWGRFHDLIAACKSEPPDDFVYKPDPRPTLGLSGKASPEAQRRMAWKRLWVIENTVEGKMLWKRLQDADREHREKTMRLN